MSSIRGYYIVANLGPCQNVEEEPPEVFQKKVFLKISQNSQEKSLANVFI